jgi:hypothetical protein
MYFLAIRNRIAPNNINTAARPCAPPFGIARKYIIPNTMQPEASDAYFSGSPRANLFATKPIIKKVTVGYIVSKIN